MAGEPCTVAFNAGMASYFDTGTGANLASAAQKSDAGLLSSHG
jgi:hypothetical protein